jgi:hypothetical protein
MDVNVLKNKGIIESFVVTAGFGFFSSISDATKANGVEFKPSRSVTAVAGAKAEFHRGLSASFEYYHKNVSDLTYGVPIIKPNEYYGDGEGKIWGIEVMLKKMESRRWDGWLSFSYTDAQYRHPSAGPGYEDWFYPAFHRLYNLNLVFNYKPVQWFNISPSFGLVGGTPISREDQSRTGLKIPLGIKLSFYNFKSQGKSQWEAYIAGEDIIGWFYQPRGNTQTGDDYMNQVRDVLSAATRFSFGFRWSY